MAFASKTNGENQQLCHFFPYSYLVLRHLGDPMTTDCLPPINTRIDVGAQYESALESPMSPQSDFRGSSEYGAGRSPVERLPMELFGTEP